MAYLVFIVEKVICLKKVDFMPMKCFRYGWLDMGWMVCITDRDDIEVCRNHNRGGFVSVASTASVCVISRMMLILLIYGIMGNS